jgi:hypothetical protein
MHVSHVVRNLLDHLFVVVDAELEFLKESVSDTHKGITGPGMEPINRSGVDESGELTSSESESVSHGRETKTHVQVTAHLVHEEFKERVGRVLIAHRFGL